MRTVVLILGIAVMVEAAPWQSSLAQARSLRRAGQTAAAEKLDRQVLEDSKNLTPVELNSMGLEFLYQARYPEAETSFRRSLDRWDQRGMKGSLSRAITGGNLGTLLGLEGRFPEAEPLLRGWLASAEAASGPDSLDVGRAANALAAAYLAWGRRNKAETQAFRAQAIFAAHPDLEDSARVDNLRTLASIRLEEGRYADGEALLTPLLKTIRDRQAVAVYNDLAVFAIRQNRLPEAEKMAREALDRARRSLPANHPLLATTLNNFAQIERFQARYLEAERDYRLALEIWRSALGANHPDLGKGLMNLAAFYHQRGRDAGAEDLYRQAAAIFESAYGIDHPLTLVARNELAEVLRAEHRFTESERLSRATLEPLERELGERDPRVRRALVNYAQLLEDTRRTSQASNVRARIENSSGAFLGQNP
jgi:tetratricopeptide (TPR) repeat protein